MTHFPLSGVLLFEIRMVCDHHPALRVTLMITEGEHKATAGKFEHFCTNLGSQLQYLRQFCLIADGRLMVQTSDATVLAHQASRRHENKTGSTGIAYSGAENYQKPKRPHQF